MCLLLVSLCYYPIRLLGIDKEGADLDALTVTFLLPSVPICHYYWELVEAEGMSITLDYSDKLVSRSIWMQPVSALLWLLLFAYLEQVLPQALAAATVLLCGEHGSQVFELRRGEARERLLGEV